MKEVTHQTLIEEYVQRKKIKSTKADIDNVFNKLSSYYTLVETSNLTEEQILTLKVEITDVVLNALDLVSTFGNRIEFAKEFFIYEPEKDLIDYIDWLENSYVEDNKEIVKNVHQNAADKITNIIHDLKIVDRNIGILYTDELFKSTNDLISYIEGR